MSEIKKIKFQNNRAIAMSLIHSKNYYENITFLNEPNGTEQTNKSKKFHSRIKQESKSFATDLASFLITEVNLKQPFLTVSRSLKNSFYKQCAKKIIKNNFFSNDIEEELLIIYMKQMMNILRQEKIVSYKENMAIVSEEITDKTNLNKRLFFSFWNKTNWNEIFPSDPSAAHELNANKEIFKDLICKNNKKKKLEAIANNFFELTGFCDKNNLLMISFLDFYLFTWLKHFNVINYIENNEDAPVYIETTNTGKLLFSTIS